MRVFAVGPTGGPVEVVGCLLADASDHHPIDHEARELSAIVASSEDAIISKGFDGTIRSWNAASERLYGYSAAEAVGRSIALIVPDELASEVGAILLEVAANRRIEHYETQRRRKDGTLVDVSLSVSPVHDTQGRVVAASVIARDVSGRRAMEDALQESERRRLEILANMLRAEEAERSRIATELHDDTVQVMTASLFALDRVALIARRSENHQIESAVTLTRATLEEATARTRRLMFELRPAILHEHGLVAAVNVLADQTRRETGARTTVSGSAGRYGHYVEELAYRSIQEALSNVRKHAGATQVVITLEDEGAALLCEVADDGRGFDPDTVRDRPGAALHAGLDTMVERIRAAGGETAVDTARGTARVCACASPSRRARPPDRRRGKIPAAADVSLGMSQPAAEVERRRSEHSKLRRELGRIDAICFLIAAIVVLDTLGAVARGGAQTVVWLAFVSALFFVPAGLVISELGTAFPYEGGPYVWARMAFGRLAGSLVALIYWIETPVWIGGSLAITGTAAVDRLIVPVDGAWRLAFVFVFIWLDDRARIRPASHRKVDPGDVRGRAGRAARVLHADGGHLRRRARRPRRRDG